MRVQRKFGVPVSGDCTSGYCSRYQAIQGSSSEIESEELLEPGIRDVDNSAVELRQALQLIFGYGVVGVLEGPEPDRLAVDEPADCTIILGPLRAIDSRARMLEQRVELGIGIIGKSHRAARMEIGIDEWLRIREVGDTPRGDLKLAGKSTSRDRCLVHLLDLHLSADLLPKLLQDLTSGAPAWCRCKEHFEFHRFAVVLDEFSRLFWIIRQRTIVLALYPGTIAVRICGWPAQAVCQDLRHCLAVYGQTSAWRTRMSSNG